MTSSERSSADALVTALERDVPPAGSALRTERQTRTIAAPALSAWTTLARRVATDAPRLLEPFVDTSVSRVGRVEAAHLERWATAGLAMAEGWRGERRAHAFLRAAAGLDRIAPAVLERWCALAPRFGKAIDDARFFDLVDPAVAGWDVQEQAAWLGAVAACAVRAPLTAAALYRTWPGSLGGVTAGLRAAVLDATAAAVPHLDVTRLERVLPVMGALLAELRPESHALAAELLREVGTGAPHALPRLLPSLGPLLESRDPERLRRWLARGLTIAAENPAAGVAFFALESRTSQRVLHASGTAVFLAEVQGEIRKFVQMLSGQPAVPHGTGPFALRPAFEASPTAGGLSLPDVVDTLDTYEDNARLLRLLAALLAGRRETGTYADPAVAERLRADGEPPHLDELVRLTDGYRVAAALRRRYPGLAADLTWACGALLARARTRRGASLPAMLDAVLALALHPDAARERVPAWLALAAAPALPALAPLATPETTIEDAIAAARALAPFFEPMPDPEAAAGVLSDLLPLLLDEPGDGEPVAGAADPTGAPDTDAPDLVDVPDDLALQLGELLGDETGTPHALSPEELLRLLEAALGTSLAQSRATNVEQLGLFVTQLLGKHLGKVVARPPGEADTLGGGRALLPRRREADGLVFRYDEWDHVIGDYRPAWCRLVETAVTEDAGVFYEQTLARHAALVPELRRHFQRLRPEMYRVLRGLEDGDDFDLGAAVDARAQIRARRTPSPKLYTSRVRQERDVATLFLVDLSASTDEEAAGTPDGQRIIDVTREALVLMAAALEEIGDAYAIYGFSGQGRDHVEFFGVKDFDERLSPAVKGRIGGMEPHGSTRMGTAIRHAITKMRGVTAPSRHLLLLSDGFPQDLDYGDDRQSHVYGIRDTATALREAQAVGVRPYCITVDLAGHDYLRDMCDPNAYLVIENVADLPRELPKIYQRLVRAG